MTTKSGNGFAYTNDGTPIAYRVDGGRGPLVLLIMGFGTPGAAWLDVPERLAEAGFRAVSFDHRGTGRSGPERRWPKPADLAADAIAVLDALRGEEVLIAGISMGGIVAQHVAFLRPRRQEVGPHDAARLLGPGGAPGPRAVVLRVPLRRKPQCGNTP